MPVDLGRIYPRGPRGQANRLQRYSADHVKDLREHAKEYGDYADYDEDYLRKFDLGNVSQGNTELGPNQSYERREKEKDARISRLSSKLASEEADRLESVGQTTSKAARSILGKKAGGSIQTCRGMGKAMRGGKYTFR